MKQIECLADLAINGAPPAFAEPLHVGRPNIGDRKRFGELLDGVFDRRWLTNDGPLVRALEERIAAELGVRHCIATCNGTAALEIAIRALGLRGEVIVPAFTFIATVHALHWLGITPVFADIDPDTHNLDPAVVRELVTPRTTGILGVHVWGRCAPVAELQAIADESGLQLLLDAAHAFGNSGHGRMIGGFGRAEVLSFHATKFFNTFEGGAIVTDHDDVANAARRMRNFGFSGYDNTVECGINGKMTEVSAAMGLVNLESLAQVVAVNRSNYEAYQNALSDIPGMRLVTYDESERNNYQYLVVELEPDFATGRDRVVEVMHAEGILARRYFWPGCHRMRPYRDLFPDAGSRLRNTEDIASRVLVLPSGTQLPDGAVAVQSRILRLLAREAA